jgi:UDP-N-acetylmuramate dehydrogenase
MELLENVPLGPKTTMRIGGNARWYAELTTRDDVEQAAAFAKEKHVPLIVLGGGSNTIFADGVIQALVVRLKNDTLSVDGTTVTVGAGKILAVLLNELAERSLDLSALTGIPGTVGGALFGNAGQGFGGTWMGGFVENITVFIAGRWKTLPRDACDFRYRESTFKDLADVSPPPLVWEAVLRVPHGEHAAIRANIETLLQRRIETQPHLKTAGSCFKSLPDGTPAWKLIDEAGLRGKRFGSIEVSEKHANFLLNIGGATFADACAAVIAIRTTLPQLTGVEMRFYDNDGRLREL